MKINSEYFPHDYDSLNDEGIEILVDEYGAIGYGVYWMFVEQLHKSENNKLKIDSQKLLKRIVKKSKQDENMVNTLLKYMIDVCELFKTDKTYFWSERVKENIQRRKDLSKRNSQNAKSRWDKVKTEEVWDEN